MAELIAYAPLLARGALVTLALAVLALGLASVLGALGAAGRLSGARPLRALAAGYAVLMRGMPDLVVILLFYFGGQRLLNDLGAALGWPPVSLSQFWAGVIAIGGIYGAYLTETFRGAYLSIPPGQTEAARALGLRRWRIARAVIWPQLLRQALPGYANVWQVLVKSTAVVSVIGLQDLVGLANDAGKSTREPFLFFAAVLGVYLVITRVSNAGVRRVERAQARWAAP